MSDNGSASVTAIVTGGSQGWGLAIAEGLAERGVQVVLCARGAAVTSAADKIRLTGGTAWAVQADCTSEASVENVLAETVERFGGVSIWVNSLGMQQPEPLVSLEVRTWEAILRTQLTSVFLGTRAAARHMIQNGIKGRILNVVGGGAYGILGASAHAASKGGALAATYSWAEELAPFGITVNAIRGGVQSPGMRQFTDSMGLTTPGDKLTNSDLRALGYYEAREAAPLAIWLTCGPTSDITGYHFGVDGARVTVYERVRRVVEISRRSGWSLDGLEGELHELVRALPRSAAGVRGERYEPET
jgi:glucose 1-dehydrogenase